MKNTLERLTQVFRDVFDDEDLVVEGSTTAADVEGWDSLTHVTLMINVEKAFKIKFSSKQVASLKNVEELVGLIEQKEQERG